jgi:hypothetical protein
LDSEYSDVLRWPAASPSAQKTFTGGRAKTLPAEDRKAMVAAELMGSVYWRLLQKLERGKFNVFGPEPAA